MTCQLGGTGVTINNKPAYLWFVSPVQINLQVVDGGRQTYFSEVLGSILLTVAGSLGNPLNPRNPLLRGTSFLSADIASLGQIGQHSGEFLMALPHAAGIFESRAI